ncbi:MAG: hypothetical protein QXK42_00495 [Candidatus Korarchaeum sp.]
MEGMGGLKPSYIFLMLLVIASLFFLQYSSLFPKSGELKLVYLVVPGSHMWLSKVGIKEVGIITGGIGDLKLVLTKDGPIRDYVVMPYDPDIAQIRNLDTQIWVYRGKNKRPVSIDKAAMECLEMNGIKINVPVSIVENNGTIGFITEKIYGGMKGKVIKICECRFDIVSIRGGMVDEKIRDSIFNIFNNTLTSIYKD